MTFYTFTIYTMEKKLLFELQHNSTWRDSEKMINHVIKNTSEIVELSDGKLILLKKPHIEKNFCFGYWDWNDEDLASEKAQQAKKDIFYFINKNLEEINGKIENIQKALDSENLTTDRGHSFYILEHERNGDLEECKIAGYYSRRTDEYNSEKAQQNIHGNDIRPATRDDLERIYKGLQNVKMAFGKRLNTYLKKYGLEKVHTWTYCTND